MKSKVDMLLKEEYELWRTRIRQEKNLGRGGCCGNQHVNPEHIDHKAILKNNEMLQ